MKHFILSFPSLISFGSHDYVYHFYVETFNSSFVEVSFTEYMDVLKDCRKYSKPHHVDVHEYFSKCYNIFLESL